MRSTALLLLLLAAACSGGSEQAASPTSRPHNASEDGLVVGHVDAEAAARLLASGQRVVVLDVRTPREFAEGHIEGAVNIDFNAPDFERRLAELDRDAHYLVHCRSGGRSTRALPTLEKLGFRGITHLDGGILAWQEAGQPLTK